MDGEQLALIQHLQLSHRRIERALGELSARLMAARDSTRANLDWRELNNRFADLRRLIRRHFSTEAAGGCLEEATIGVPGLGAELEQLEQQHGELLGELDGIMTSNRQRHLDRGWREYLCQQFGEFRRHMHAHEAAEARLIQIGLNINLDLAESSPPRGPTTTRTVSSFRPR